jgi:hypothetical protein
MMTVHSSIAPALAADGARRPVTHWRNIFSDRSDRVYKRSRISLEALASHAPNFGLGGYFKWSDIWTPVGVNVSGKYHNQYYIASAKKALDTPFFGVYKFSVRSRKARLLLTNIHEDTYVYRK